MTETRAEKRVCLGAFAGAHGVKGAAKIRTFTAEESGVAAYGPLTTEDGARRFALRFVRALKPGLALVTAPEIRTREEAEALAGIRLYAPRAALPQVDDPDEFYLEDLVGLAAFDTDGETVGRITGVHNFGAGDLIEIARPSGGPALFAPFTKAVAPLVDLAAERMVVDLKALEDVMRPPSDISFTLDSMRQEDA